MWWTVKPVSEPVSERVFIIVTAGSLTRPQSDYLKVFSWIHDSLCLPNYTRLHTEFLSGWNGEWNEMHRVHSGQMSTLFGLFSIQNRVQERLSYRLSYRFSHRLSWRKDRIEIISKWLAINYRAPLMLLPKWFQDEKTSQKTSCTEESHTEESCSKESCWKIYPTQQCSHRMRASFIHQHSLWLLWHRVARYISKQRSVLSQQ